LVVVVVVMMVMVVIRMLMIGKRKELVAYRGSGTL